MIPANIPSRTLIWTLEYPLVTFLTLLITFDILTAEAVNYLGEGRVCESWVWMIG